MKNTEEELLTATIAIDRPKKGEKTIPVICSRCNTIFQLPRWLVAEGTRVAPSHGLCPDCHDIMLMEHQEFLKERKDDPEKSGKVAERKKLWSKFFQPFLPVSRKNDD